MKKYIYIYFLILRKYGMVLGMTYEILKFSRPYNALLDLIIKAHNVSISITYISTQYVYNI